MASYTANQLYGAGTPCEEISGNTNFSITSSNDQVTYFTMETVRNGVGFYDSSSATNALGTYTNLVNVTTLITSSYIASVCVGVGGGSFDFEPTDTIALSGSFFRGTGGINLNVSSLEIPFTASEIIDPSGANIFETNVGPLTIEVKATSYQVSPIQDGYIKVNDTTIKVTTFGDRGHTLAVLDSEGNVVGDIVTYDTFGESPAESTANLAALTSALSSVDPGNFVVLATWDACAVNQELRDELLGSYGATLTTTWSPSRYSHIFVGQKN
jgi:hypothetical protein